MTLNNRRRLLCSAIAATTVIAGLIWRLAPLGLSPFLYKYGGSALWAAMVYWIFAAMLPRTTPFRLAIYAGIFAALVELSRLCHTPGMDAFRMTMAGKLLLGRFFAVKDIVAYWVAILLTSLADRRQ